MLIRAMDRVIVVVMLTASLPGGVSIAGESALRGIRLCEAARSDGAYVVETTGRVTEVQAAITARADKEPRLGTVDIPAIASVVYFSVDNVGGMFLAAERGAQNVPRGRGVISPGDSVDLIVDLSQAPFMAPVGIQGVVRKDLLQLLARPGRHRIKAFVCSLGGPMVTGSIRVQLMHRGGGMRLVEAPGQVPAGKRACPSCKGTGQSKCTVCGGSGRLGSNLGLAGTNMWCAVCKGTGKGKCARCGGRGWVEPPRSAARPATSQPGESEARTRGRTGEKGGTRDRSQSAVSDHWIQGWEPHWAASTDKARNKAVDDPLGGRGRVLQVWGEHGWWATFRRRWREDPKRVVVRGYMMRWGGDWGPTVTLRDRFVGANAVDIVRFGFDKREPTPTVGGKQFQIRRWYSFELHVDLDAGTWRGFIDSTEVARGTADRNRSINWVCLDGGQPGYYDDVEVSRSAPSGRQPGR